MLPLNGVRVLAIEQYGAGPFGTMFLADQGAEVIKVENPNDGGDMSRAVGPYFLAPGDSEFFQSFNRNKKSLTLDLSRPEGQSVLHDLVRTADAVASNLRGDVPAKLGLVYERLKRSNPKIVCAHLSAYGRSGPRADWPGFDYLMQAEAGYFSLTGEPGAPPARFGLSVVDLMSGLGLAYALLAALTAARATGSGRDIDVSLFDIALFNTCYLATWYLNEGVVTGRLPRSAHPALTPCQLYRTRDGWIYIMCNKEKFWPALCAKLERPEWIEDARFRRFPDRLRHRDLLTGMLDRELERRTTAEWLERFAGVVPAAPVNDLAQALDNPFVTEHGRLQTLPHPARGSFRMVASPVRCGSEEPPARPAPGLGAHTEELLQEIGYNHARIRALREAKVI
ncbi:MAG TPA: CoA transferase [Burkholderiales bacterium]|jgi:crotonobetainyl-CoA:carnitine CoA-transferase CaiB-like acyl-CoA transferase